MRFFLALTGAAALVGCSTATPPSTTTSGAEPSTEHAVPSSSAAPPEAPSELERVIVACDNVIVHLGNADATLVLHAMVPLRQLGLGAGAHTVDLAAVGDAMSMELVAYAEPADGDFWCTDLESGAPPPVVHRWRAVSGELVLSIDEPPAEGVDNVLDLTLRSVTFAADTGEERTIDARFERITFGWLPG